MRIALSLSSLLLPALLAAQAPERPLPKPEAALEESFTTVGSVRELKDGRVLVLDRAEKAIFVADLAKGTVTKVSREGGGPLEYRFPMLLIPRADSTYLLDVMNGRFLIFDAAGAPVKTRSIVASQDPGAMLRAASIKAIDARGRWYAQVSPLKMDQGQIRVGGAASVVRWIGDSSRVDTLASLMTPTQNSTVSGTPQAGMRLKVTISPPEVQDGWDLLPNGTIAVVRGADYHVEYIQPDGKVIRGGVVPHVKVPVTPADQERIRKEVRAGYEQALKGGMAAAGQEFKLAVDVEDPKEWPKLFPPFETVRAAPDGKLWISPVSRGDASMVWDVVGPGGALAMRVRFPARTALVGFGKGSVYTIRKDEDDLQYLQRHPLPQ